jgi:NitT/TauT family transport system ATP-binding protein
MRNSAYGGIPAGGRGADHRPVGRDLSNTPVSEPAQSEAAAPALLGIRQLTHRFAAPTKPSQRGAPVLDRISLRVDPGEVVALVGPSGCGKSTLLNLASGLTPRQSGSITLEDQELRGPDPRLGLVFQQPALLPWLTVRGNVGFGLTLRHSERLSASQRRERIQSTLDLVGLQLDPETTPAHLSGGMAQRVALARVLVRNPRVLLLDEPFSALDAVTRAEMQQLLLHIVDKLGTGILIVTHDVDEAIHLGDRILLMRPKPGTIEREWFAGRGAQGKSRDMLRREVIDGLSEILKSRSP